jgi:hypothetical protein
MTVLQLRTKHGRGRKEDGKGNNEIPRLMGAQFPTGRLTRGGGGMVTDDTGRTRGDDDDDTYST